MKPTMVEVSSIADDALLDEPVYDVVEAGRLLQVPPRTLEYWLEGGRQGGKMHPPVLREVATGSKNLSWGEFVEARYVRAYRRDHKVALESLRGFILQMRSNLNVPHPLAHRRPWVGEGRRLLLGAQLETDLAPNLWSVFEPRTGTVLLTAPAESSLAVVEFADDIVRRIRPRGESSPVVIDPAVRFGAASVRGISTMALRELVDAGDAIELVAEDYGLSMDETIAALEFERQLLPVAA